MIGGHDTDYIFVQVCYLCGTNGTGTLHPCSAQCGRLFCAGDNTTIHGACISHRPGLLPTATHPASLFTMQRITEINDENKGKNIKPLSTPTKCPVCIKASGEREPYITTYRHSLHNSGDGVYRVPTTVYAVYPASYSFGRGEIFGTVIANLLTRYCAKSEVGAWLFQRKRPSPICAKSISPCRPGLVKTIWLMVTSCTRYRTRTKPTRNPNSQNAGNNGS